MSAREIGKPTTLHFEQQLTLFPEKYVLFMVTNMMGRNCLSFVSYIGKQHVSKYSKFGATKIIFLALLITTILTIYSQTPAISDEMSISMLQEPLSLSHLMFDQYGRNMTDSVVAMLTLLRQAQHIESGQHLHDLPNYFITTVYNHISNKTIICNPYKYKYLELLYFQLKRYQQTGKITTNLTKFTSKSLDTIVYKQFCMLFLFLFCFYILYIIFFCFA